MALGVVVGLAIGLIGPGAAPALRVLGEVFLHLISMMIVPLLFPLVALSIATIGSVGRLGRLAGKSFLYFEIVTTIILLLGLMIGNITDVGSGAPIGNLPRASTGSISEGIDFTKFILGAVPSNIISAFSSNNLLAVIVFGVFFGLAMVAAGQRAAPIHDVLDSLSRVMFSAIKYVIRLSPIAVLGYVGYAVAAYGVTVLVNLAEFIGIVYIGCLIVALGLFPLIALIFRVRYFRLLREVMDLMLIAFVTRSTEAVLAPLLVRLERYGVHRRVVSFTLPLGYSFNADGSTLYEAIALLFVAHAFHVPMNFGQQMVAIGVLAILTKGIAGVPSSSIVVLLAASQVIGLPPEGAAVLLAVDFVVDMARAAVNIAGNSLATIVIAQSENAFNAAATTAPIREMESSRPDQETTGGTAPTAVP